MYTNEHKGDQQPAYIPVAAGTSIIPGLGSRHASQPVLDHFLLYMHTHIAYRRAAGRPTTLAGPGSPFSSGNAITLQARCHCYKTSYTRVLLLPGIWC